MDYNASFEAAEGMRTLGNLADNVRTGEEWDWYHEYKAEQWAETAWLRHAESLGWEEAYREEMIEAGFWPRY